jgi:hypothetical protein
VAGHSAVNSIKLVEILKEIFKKTYVVKFLT